MLDLFLASGSCRSVRNMPHSFCLLLLFISLAFAKQTTLSDPFGLDSERRQENMEDYVVGSLLPLPQSQTPTADIFGLDPSIFKFIDIGEKSDVLTFALDRYFALTFPSVAIKSKSQKDGKEPNVNGDITSLSVNVKEPYSDLTLQSDESYTLIVGAPTAELTANTVWGALRGLETFSQLVYQDVDNNFLANGNKIMDFPRYHYRGFMIDTARHYINLKTIKKHMEAMSYSKFNVLHWHIVDDQSFPFVSETFPSLSGQGAYNNKTHIYSVENIMEIIEYGRLHGIRVVPEFDTPGHSQSFGSIPNLLTPCYKSGKPTGSFGPINPTLDSTYDFLTKFFTEVAGRFPDHYLHLGGDEVGCTCWMSNPQIQEWMKAKNISTCNLLEQYYEQKLLDIINNLNKGYIVWQEIFDNKVKVRPDTVINIWKGGWAAEMSKVTEAGLQAILSSCWYLNYISYGADWTKYYKCDPGNFTGTAEQKKLVMGGSACMWAEYVDATNLLSRTWPRAMAVGEKLWSSEEATAVNHAGSRLHEHRCRYLMRGIPAEVANGTPSFCRYEWPY